MTVLKGFSPASVRGAPEAGSGASPAPASSPGSVGGQGSDAPASGGGAPTAPGPGAAVAPATVTHEVAPDPTDGTFDMSGAFDGSIDIPADDGSPPLPTAPVAPPPVQQVAPPTPALAPQPVAPPTAQPAQPAEAQPGSGAQPSLDPTQPRQLAEAFAANEPALVDAVAQEHFQLSNEEREAFEADPTGQLPRLGAKVFLKAQQIMLSQMDRIVPAMIQRHVEVMARQNAGKNQFYASNPNLDRSHDAIVDSYARMLRAQNPQMPRDEFITTLGRVVSAVVGTTVPAQRAPAANGSQPPTRAAQAAPFVPAGGSPPMGAQAPEVDPWSGLGMDFER